MPNSTSLELTAAIALLITSPAIAAPSLAPTQPSSSIAQTPTNDFGLPPAPPVIETAPDSGINIPVQPAPAIVPPIQSNPLPSAGSSLLFPTAPIRSTNQSNPLQLPDVNPSLAIPNSLPSMNAPTSQPIVKVPQLDRRSTPAQPIPTEPRVTAIEDTPVPARLRMIEFGQPLPNQ